MTTAETTADQTEMRSITVRRARDLQPHTDAIVGIYNRAFQEWPYNHNATAASRFREALAAHTTYPDFEAVLVYQGEKLLGFVYGHTNGTDQWWYRQISPHLARKQREQVFDGAWVIVELAVDPDARRRGLGRWLLRATMADKPNAHAVLSTIVAESPAIRLYDEEGFTPLVPEFSFPEATGVWTVLGRQLGR